LNGKPMGFCVLDVETHSSPLWQNFIAFLPFYILHLIRSKHGCVANFAQEVVKGQLPLSVEG
jgi:hypothetical protein